MAELEGRRDSPEWTEPGRHVNDLGQIVYEWPPRGRFAEMWARIDAALPDPVEKCDALALLRCWQDETSTLVAYTDDTGEWVDVEPDWDVPAKWLADG